MFQVAIDGPAGAGKSSIARAAAKELGFIYIDTGAMYRAVALKAIDEKIDLDDCEKVAQMAENTKITLAPGRDGQRVYTDGADVTGRIRTPEVSMAASKVSAIERVRSALVKMQREIAEGENVIMDGRDIGTVVLPNADVKIFLTASSEKRAERRLKELSEKGVEADFEEIKRAIEERDRNDMTRAASPLKKADDAVTLDTSLLSLEESIDAAVKYIKNGMGK